MARNDCPAPRGFGPGWGGGGTAGATVDVGTIVEGMACPLATRTVNGTTAGNARVSAPARTFDSDIGGQTWTVLLQVMSPVAMTATIELYFRTASNGQVTGGTTFPANVAVPANTPTWLVHSAVAPTGYDLRKVQAGLLARTLPAGATIYATAARYDQGDQRSTIVYRDGSSGAPWRWEGESSLSTSTDAPPPAQTINLGTRPSAQTSGNPTVTRGPFWRLDTSKNDVVAAGAKASGSQRQIGPPTNAFNDPTVPWPAVIEAAPDGVRSVKFTIPENYTRYEAVANVRDWVVGDDIYFAWEFYLPVGFPKDVNDFQVVWQLHAAPSTGSPPVCVEVRNGALRQSGGANRPGAATPGQYAYDLLLLAEVQTGRRYRGVTRVVFSDQPGGGRIDTWVDGQPVSVGFAPPCGTVYGPDISAEGGPTYGPKFGIYHRASLPALTIWHGRHAIGQTYAEVDPITPGTAVQRTIPGRASTRTSGAPTVTAAPRTITLGSRPSAATSGSPTVARGTVSRTPAGRSSTATSGAPSLARGPVVLAPATRTPTRVSGTPTVLVGPVSRTLTGRSSTASSGAPTATVLQPILRPLGRPSAATSGRPALIPGAVTRTVPGRAPQATSGHPELLVGPISRSIPARAPVTTVGLPTVDRGPVTRLVPGRASAAAAGRLVLLVGPVTRTPAGSGPASTSGRPTLHVAVLLVGRASTATSGTPTVIVGPVRRTPSAREPAQASGTSELLVGAVTRDVGGRPSQARSGEVDLELGTVTRTPAARTPERDTGDPDLSVGPITRTLAQRPSAATAGSPGILLGAIIRYPDPAPSQATSGEPDLTVGPIVRVPRGRPSTRTAGRPVLLVGRIVRSIPGHQRPDRAGTPTVRIGTLTRRLDGTRSQVVHGAPTVVRGTTVTVRPGRLTVTDGGPSGLVVVDEPLDNGMAVSDGW